MNETFAKRIKQLRKEKGSTQQELADLLKIRRSTYGEYERGKIAPPLDKTNSLAKHFGVSVDYLIGNVHRETVEHKEEDRSDIEKTMKELLAIMQSQQLTLDGELLDEESRELLISSLENSLQMAKIIKKGRSQ